MIFQYHLSIYSVNFFTLPTFSNFKVRLINQQNGDCNDSTMLNTQLINSSTFPVEIKLRGSERLLMKVKIIAFKTKQVEIVIGQGVVNIDKKTIQNSIRVPIYDKKQGVEEVAICSVDFYVSGHHISKNVSFSLDKSKSKIEDWRDHTEDAVYSQMSYTVQSENQRIQIETAPKNTNQISNRKVENQNQNQNQNSVESLNAKSKRVVSREENYQSNQIDYRVQPQSPLQNSAYLSQLPSPSRKYSIKRQQLQNEGKRKTQQQNKVIEENHEQDQTIDAQNLKKKIQQQQKITKQLKRYLAKHKQKQRTYSTQIKTQKHKVRRKDLKVEQISSYKSQSKYIKYFTQPNQKYNFSIKNVKAHQITQNDVKENNYNLGVQVPINKFNLSTVSNQKIVNFDALGYRAYCIANYIKEYSIQISVPQTQEGLKVNVQLNNFGNFEGIIGVQQGQYMAVILKSKEKDKNNILSPLKKQVYKLIFDIIHKGSYVDIQDTTKYQKNDISYRQPNQISSSQTNIRDRIQSFSIQPWGYGYSYLNQKSNAKIDIMSKIKQKRKLIKTEVEQKKDDSKAEEVNKELNKKQGLKFIQQLKKYTQPLQSEKQLKKTQIISIQSDKKQKKKLKSESRSSQCQSLEQIRLVNKEKNQIMSIRNGNRNNYKFKKQNEQKKPNIKQMWQKLLIKKKVQQQGSDKSRYRPQIKKTPVSRFTNQSRDNQSLIIQEREFSPVKSNLYTVLPEDNRVLKVGEGSRPQQYNLAPLRTITIQIKNISITQPLSIVAEQLGEKSGKFIKLQIKSKIVYYTEIIFNGQFNSILWKLSGCLFHQLRGNQHLEIQIYKTVQNKIVMLGQASIRVSKLYFLRNNHIFNGKIIYNKILNGQFTLGFEVLQNFPFEIIQQENDQFENKSLVIPKFKDKNMRKRQRDESLGSIVSSKSNKKAEKIRNQSLLMRNNNRIQLKDTLRRDYNINRKANRVIQDSLEVGVSELQQSNLMPQGLAEQIRKR